MSAMKRKGLFQRYRLGRNHFRKQIVITAERSETYIIRQEQGASVRAWCADCAGEIECLTVEQVVTLTGLSARKVFRLVEAEGIHFRETDDGRLLVCPNSVALMIRADVREFGIEILDNPPASATKTTYRKESRNEKTNN